jgi:hypothetical protein
LAIVAFLAVMIATVSLAFVLENLRPGMPAEPAASKRTVPDAAPRVWRFGRAWARALAAIFAAGFLAVLSVSTLSARGRGARGVAGPRRHRRGCSAGGRRLGCIIALILVVVLLYR